MKTEKLDASNYCPTGLKTRLQRDYPQLVFHRPATRNQSELVFVEELSVGEVAERRGAADTDGASSGESDDDQELTPEFITNKREVTLKEYYDVAMALQNTIKGAQAMDTSWPPSSVNLSTTQVLKMVPIMLFNFIAWILGFSDYPEMSCHLELEDSHKTKVLSIYVEREQTNTKVASTGYGCKAANAIITTHKF